MGRKLTDVRMRYRRGGRDALVPARRPPYQLGRKSPRVCNEAGACRMQRQQRRHRLAVCWRLGPTDYEVESIIFIQSQGGLVRHN